MDDSCKGTGRRSPHARAWRLVAAALLVCHLGGCAAVTNPIVGGVPVRRLPPGALQNKPRELQHTLPLTLLGQKAPDVYRVDVGDVLGVYIEGVLGDRNVAPPVNLAPAVEVREQRRLPPAFGYPLSVREDGTVTVPLVGPVRVARLSLAEVQEAIRRACVAREVLQPGRERIVVTLLHPRQYNVVVMRQESSNITLAPGGGLGGGKRGTGHLVDLPAYENDVLHALAETGGLPGLDTFNAVVIFRGCFGGGQDRAAFLHEFQALPPGAPWLPAGGCREVVRIPLRLLPGEPPPFGPQDVILQSGDVVFLEARDAELFYTGGLLPPGEYVLPRDYDLDVVEAVARVQGSLINGAFGGSNLSGALIAPGIGNPSPSMLTVLRRLPGGEQLPIRVDLRRALTDSRERIRVQSGDVLLLQEMPSEALTRYFSQTFLNFSLAWQAIHERFVTGVVDISTPERIPNRVGVINNR